MKKTSEPGACYRNKSLRKGDRARVVAKVSRYIGVEGDVRVIDAVSGYALVELPKGTTMRIEGRDANQQPNLKPKVKGEVQWFPVGWLQTIPAGQDAFEFTGSAGGPTRVL